MPRGGSRTPKELACGDLPGSSDPDSPDDSTVEGKGAEDTEDVEMSLEAKLPGAIAWVEGDTDADGQTPPKA